VTRSRGIRRRQKEDVMVRFWRYVHSEPNTGCWLWVGALHEAGYGMLNVDQRAVRAHRISYEHFRGPIPADLELDHLCRQRCCVNPDHLEAVSHQENMRRGQLFDLGELSRRKDSCPFGHPYDEQNTVSYRGHRKCRACHTQDSKARSIAARSPEYPIPHQRRKTHCPQGHPYNSENTRLYQGRRYCKICQKRHRDARVR
jgi:hypothetical protein